MSFGEKVVLSENTISTKQFPSFNELKLLRYFDQNPRGPEWKKHERHFFVITDSSRPVYIRYGEEINVTPILCTVVAFTGQLVRDGDQKLQNFRAGDKFFVFYLPSPFIFVCVSSVPLPISLLEKELKYLELVIFSLLTPMIAVQLQRRPNFDIRRQTSSAERLFTSMLHMMDTSHTFLFHDCVPMCGISRSRNDFKSIVYEHESPSVFGVVIFYLGEVFLIMETKKYHLDTEDIIILSNNTYPQNDSLSNSWAPIFLPCFQEMIHILTVDVDKFGLKMILISNQIDACPECTRVSEAIINDMKTKKNKDLDICGIPQFRENPVIHWIACNKQLSQVHSPYIDRTKYAGMADLIYRQYAWIIDYINDVGTKGMFYFAFDNITIIGKSTNNEMMMVAMDVGVPKERAVVTFSHFESYLNENKDVFFDFDSRKWE